MTECRFDQPFASFSTDDLPAPDRLPSWREFYARKVLSLEWEQTTELSFSARMSCRNLPGVRIYDAACSPFHASLTRSLMRADEPRIFVILAQQGEFVVRQFDREVVLAPGDATALCDRDPAQVSSSGVDNRRLNLSLSAARLRPLVRDLDAALVQRIPAGLHALTMLRLYIDVLQGAFSRHETPGLDAAASHHIYDLVALVLGATRDGRVDAQRGGLAAARLASIKSDVIAGCHEPSLSLGVLARKHGVTPRYVRALFEKDGTTFSDFLRSARLGFAHRLLTTRGSHARAISEIAYDAGFNDLSNFNHAFRKHFGASPSEIRSRARERPDEA